MSRQLVECVPNFSEGRDAAKIDAIVQAILAVPEVVLLDRESDADHNRCVLTFVGPPAAVADAAFRAVEKAVASDRPDAAHRARIRASARPTWCRSSPSRASRWKSACSWPSAWATRSGASCRVPVYLYEAAARRPERVNLENIRRGQFEALVQEMGTVPARDPDIGDPVCHPTAGATVVGARKFLIAYNINLEHAGRRHRQTDRQDDSLLLRRLPLREVDGSDAGFAQPGPGFHQPHRFRADAHAPGVRDRAPRGGALRRAGGGQRDRRA